MGGWQSIVAQMFPGEPTWTGKDVPDLAGKVALVTGGSSGVGKETVKVLLKKNAKVYLTARTERKARTAIEELEAETGHKALFLELELSDLRSVRSAVAAFLSRERELHILCLNAGVMWCHKDLLTVQGYDMHIGTNVIGHWLLMELLLPAVQRAARTSPESRSRIVWTASSAAYLGQMNTAAFKPGPARDGRATFDIYNDSKLLDIICAREASRRYAGAGVVVTSVNPGNTATDLWRHGTAFEMWFFSKIHYEPWYGALPILYASTAPETLDANGKFIIPWHGIGSPPPAALDPKLGEELWDWLKRETVDDESV